MDPVMCDFLIAGGTELRVIWPKAALESGQLLCAGGHEGDCSWETGCGVGNQTMRFNIVPITSVEGLDSVNFDSLYLVTPSKKYLSVNDKIALHSIQEFLECLQEKGIAVFSSQEQGVGRRWVAFR